MRHLISRALGRCNAAPGFGEGIVEADLRVNVPFDLDSGTADPADPVRCAAVGERGGRLDDIAVQAVGATVAEDDGARGGIFLLHFPLAQGKGFTPEADTRRRAGDGGLFEDPSSEQAGLEVAGRCWRRWGARAAGAEQDNDQGEGAPKGVNHAEWMAVRARIVEPPHGARGSWTMDAISSRTNFMKA